MPLDMLFLLGMDAERQAYTMQFFGVYSVKFVKERLLSVGNELKAVSDQSLEMEKFS